MQHTILLVDDNPSNLALLFKHLRSIGMHVRVVDRGLDAVEQCAHIKPDLILLDVRMPGMDGYATCRAIKSNPNNADIPVLFLSALTDTDDRLKGFDVGGVDFITKPIDVQEVTARVNTHLALAHLQRELAAANQQLANTVEQRTTALQSETQRRETQESEKEQLLELLRTQYERLAALTEQALRDHPIADYEIKQLITVETLSELASITRDLQQAANEISAEEASPPRYYAQIWSAYQRLSDMHDYLTTISRNDISSQTDAKSPSLSVLTKRERQILTMICDGLTSGTIAMQLNLSEVTVRTYRTRISKKLNIAHLPGLIKFAIRHGLTTLD